MGGCGAVTVLMGTDFERRKATVIREAEVGGKTYRAFVYGRAAAQVSQSNIPLHGIALDGKMAVSSEPVRILAPDEAKALVKVRGQSVEVICGVSGRDAGFRKNKRWRRTSAAR